MENVDLNNMPKHVAIIMDGNGRWAKHRKLSRSQGHMEGVKRVEEIIDHSRKLGIKVLTLFTFSTENWSRPENEVSMLMNMLTAVLNKKIQKLKDDKIRFQTIGRMEGIPDFLYKTLTMVMDETKDNDELVLNLAFNYGSRLEITDAVKKIVSDVQEGKLAVDDISEEHISQSLYTSNLPDPDLLIRTSGERRISNFLLWQLSYTEFYFTEKFWPDFDKNAFEEAICDYQNRDRRFGNLNAMEAE